MDEQIEIDLSPLQKAKTRKRVWVKPTAQKKGYYREQEVGQKEIEKKPPRKDTGKIASLPDDIKKEILELRRLGDSGESIKSQIENMIDASDDPKIKDNLADKGILKSSSGPTSLNVTGQSLVDWAKARGVESRKKRKTVKAVETAAKEIEETRFKEANEKLARLQTENKMLQGQLDRERKSKMESDSIRDKLRNENYILREKLKGLGKPVKEPVKETDNKKLVAQYLAGIEYSSRHLKSAKIEKSAGGRGLQIEIDLNVFNKAQDEGVSESRPGLVKKKVTVKRGGKTFQQYRWVRTGAEEVEETKPSVEEPVVKPKKELAIIGLNKPEPEPEKKPKIEEKGFAHKLKVGDMVDVGGGNVREVISIDKENRSASIGRKGGNAFNYDFDLLNGIGKELSEEEQYAFSGFARDLKSGDIVTFMGEDKVVDEINIKGRSVTLEGEEYDFVEINEVGKFKSKAEETFIEVSKNPPKEDQMGLLKNDIVPSWSKMPKTMKLPKSTTKHFEKMLDMTKSEGKEIHSLWGVGNDTIAPGKINIGKETSCVVESHNGKWSHHHTHPEGGILSFSPADIWGVAAKVEVDPNNISTMQDERTKMLWVAVPSTETLDVVKGTHHLKVEEKYRGKCAKEQSELWMKHEEMSEEHAQATRQVIGRMAKRLKIKLYHGMPGEELKQYDGKW